MLTKVQGIEDEIDFATDQLDYKIEYEQIKFLGIDLNYEMFYNFNSIVAALVFALAEKVISQTIGNGDD